MLSSGYYDAYYLKAQQVRTLIRQDYERAFERVDVVAMPTSPTDRVQARAIGPKTRCRCICRTSSPSASTSPGCPGVSVPCGLTAGRLPIGLQFIGRAMGEATILRVADAVERVTPSARELPPDVRPG